MKIPFFDLTRQYSELKEEVEARVCEVMGTGQYIEGSAVKEFETSMGEYLGVRHVITCGNGTDALRIALQASGVKAGDQVITTAFSFFATAEAIAQTGAVPVFADIDRNTLNLDVTDVKKKLTKDTKAILPFHIFGLPADMDELNELADRHGIPVIEDACQAIGAEYHGKKTGGLGTAGCFSFYPTKNLGAFGDGGMITTDRDEIADACRAFKAHAAGKLGAKTRGRLYGEEVPELTAKQGDSLYDPCKYFNYFIGGNSRLDSMQAAVLLVKQKHLDEYNEKRRKIAAMYSKGLEGLPVQTPWVEREDRVSCWHQYAVLCDRKEELIQYLGENGIGAGTFYPVPLHLQKAFGYLGYEPGSLPAAEDVCRRSVCLPIFPELTEEEVSGVIQAVRRFF